MTPAAPAVPDVLLGDPSDLVADALAPEADEFLVKQDVLHRLKCSDPTLWRWIKDGKFPAPYRLSTRALWKKSEVDQWFKNLTHE